MSYKPLLVSVRFQRETLGINIAVGLVGREDGETARLGGGYVEGVERRHTILEVCNRLQNDLLFLLAADGDDVEEIGEQADVIELVPFQNDK